MFCRKGALEISQNSQENTCARSLFFNKVATPPVAASVFQEDDHGGVYKILSSECEYAFESCQ